MALTANTSFAHRHNSNGTIDTICLKCFQTVGTAKAEDGLIALEAVHKCGGFEFAYVLRPESKRP